MLLMRSFLELTAAATRAQGREVLLALHAYDKSEPMRIILLVASPCIRSALFSPFRRAMSKLKPWILRKVRLDTEMKLCPSTPDFRFCTIDRQGVNLISETVSMKHVKWRIECFESMKILLERFNDLSGRTMHR